jgi:hypothetical protein
MGRHEPITVSKVEETKKDSQSYRKTPRIANDEATGELF